MEPYVLPSLFNATINPKIISVTKSIKSRSILSITSGILNLPKKDEIPNTPNKL